ncbi:hypothetical protein FJZ31_02695 [Candidatus Poribacteria bacterium]|nr:hypothetical protein [Candidatus Poribacteria bacterium]
MAEAIYKGVVKNNRVVLQTGINLPDGLEVEVIPVVGPGLGNADMKDSVGEHKANEIERITMHTQEDWLEQARHVREQIAAQIGGYAGDSVREIKELREDRTKAIGE